MERYSEIENVNISKITQETKEIYRFKINTDEINRNGWKTISAGIKLDNYKKNNIVLLDHWKSDVIGNADVFLENNELYADITFHNETDESKLTKKLVDKGVLKCTSIGIRPIKTGEPIQLNRDERKYYPSWRVQETGEIEVFTESDLFEISIVPIPANPDATFIEKINTSLDSNEKQSYYQKCIELLNKESNKNTELFTSNYKNELLSNFQSELLKLTTYQSKITKNYD